MVTVTDSWGASFVCNLGRREVEEGVHSLKSLFETLERMEKKITDVNKEISKVSELMDKKEQEIDELSEGDDNHFKHDNKLSVKKELRNDDGEVDDAEELQEQQLGGDEDGEHVVRVHVADMTPGKVSGLGDSAEKASVLCLSTAITIGLSTSFSHARMYIYMCTCAGCPASGEHDSFQTVAL